MKASKLEWATLPSELADLRATRPGIQAVLRTFERTGRMHREGKPESGRVRARSHVVDVGIFRIGDPERRGGVVRRDQDFRVVLAGGFEVQAVRGRPERAKVGRIAGQAGVALGLDCQIADVLVAFLDAVFHKEAVAHSIVGHVILNLQVVGAVDRHTAVVGVVDRRVPDVLSRASVTDQMPVYRVARKLQVLAHAIELNTRRRTSCW